MLRIPNVFYADRHSTGASADATIADHATRMLLRVARDRSLRPAGSEIAVERCRRSPRCRGTLRTPSVMLQMDGSRAVGSATVSFRTRRGRFDVSGSGDNAVSLGQLDTHEDYEALLERMRLAAALDGERR